VFHLKSRLGSEKIYCLAKGLWASESPGLCANRQAVGKATCECAPKATRAGFHRREQGLSRKWCPIGFGREWGNCSDGDCAARELAAGRSGHPFGLHCIFLGFESGI